MPGGKKIRKSYGPNLAIEIEPVRVKHLEEDEAEQVQDGRTYFTDEQITLGLTVRNNTEKTVRGDGNGALTWILLQPTAADEVQQVRVEGFELDPGEETTKERTFVFPYQGSVGAAVPVPPPGDSIVQDERADEIILDPNPSQWGIDTLYTFRVWDREEYNQTIQIPQEQNNRVSRLTRDLQYLTAVLLVIAAVDVFLLLANIFR